MLQKHSLRNHKIPYKEPKNSKDSVLVCCGDESNHGGIKNEYGEVVVVTFSQNTEDFTQINFQNKRDYNLAQQWLKNNLRDYLFTVLIGPHFKHTYSNLPFAVPRLVDEYLTRKNLHPSKIGIFVDGELRRDDLIELKKHYKKISKIHVRGVRKEKSNGKEIIYCPPGLFVADNLSNKLFNSKISLETLLKDSRFVAI
ncbi:MAG: hypothetical protein AABY22_00235 [Nanoarchaeota archaeon]